MVSRRVTVKNPSGLHVKPAEIFSKAAEDCSSKVEVLYGNNIINAKSLLNLLAVAIHQGAVIELRCTGPDEEVDLEKMVQVMDQLE